MARLQSILDTSSAAMTAQPYRRCKPPQRRRSSAAVKRSKAAGSTPMQRATASIGVCTPGCLDMQLRSSTAGVMPFAAALSVIVRAVVRKSTIVQLLGDDRPRTLAVAAGLGAASSSCSYAAVALARSLFRKGANFTAAMAFEIASTNLVVELGIILALLMGWQFTAAEFVGGPIMIVVWPCCSGCSCAPGSSRRPVSKPTAVSPVQWKATPPWTCRCRARDRFGDGCFPERLHVRLPCVRHGVVCDCP
jgi:hypothetical protein